MSFYKEDKEELLKLKKCLAKINVSVAHALDSDIEEILTIHRLKVPSLQEKSFTRQTRLSRFFQC